MCHNVHAQFFPLFPCTKNTTCTSTCHVIAPSAEALAQLALAQCTGVGLDPPIKFRVALALAVAPPENPIKFPAALAQNPRRGHDANRANLWSLL
jgi:hypothetical protein